MENVRLTSFNVNPRNIKTEKEMVNKEVATKKVEADSRSALSFLGRAQVEMCKKEEPPISFETKIQILKEKNVKEEDYKNFLVGDDKSFRKYIKMIDEGAFVDNVTLIAGVENNAPNVRYNSSSSAYINAKEHLDIPHSLYSCYDPEHAVSLYKMGLDECQAKQYIPHYDDIVQYIEQGYTGSEAAELLLFSEEARKEIIAAHKEKNIPILLLCELCSNAYPSNVAKAYSYLEKGASPRLAKALSLHCLENPEGAISKEKRGYHPVFAFCDQGMSEQEALLASRILKNVETKLHEENTDSGYSIASAVTYAGSDEIKEKIIQLVEEGFDFHSAESLAVSGKSDSYFALLKAGFDKYDIFHYDKNLPEKFEKAVELAKKGLNKSQIYYFLHYDLLSPDKLVDYMKAGASIKNAVYISKDDSRSEDEKIKIAAFLPVLELDLDRFLNDINFLDLNNLSIAKDYKKRGAPSSCAVILSNLEDCSDFEKDLILTNILKGKKIIEAHAEVTGNEEEKNAAKILEKSNEEFLSNTAYILLIKKGLEPSISAKIAVWMANNCTHDIDRYGYCDAYREVYISEDSNSTNQEKENGLFKDEINNILAFIDSKVKEGKTPKEAMEELLSEENGGFINENLRGNLNCILNGADLMFADAFSKCKRMQNKFLDLIKEGVEPKTAQAMAVLPKEASSKEIELYKQLVEVEDFANILKSGIQNKDLHPKNDNIIKKSAFSNFEQLAMSGLTMDDIQKASTKLFNSTVKLSFKRPVLYMNITQDEIASKGDGKNGVYNEKIESFWADHFSQALRMAHYIDTDTINQMMDKRFDEFEILLNHFDTLTNKNYEIAGNLITLKNEQTGKPLAAKDKIGLLKTVKGLQDAGIDPICLQNYLNEDKTAIDLNKLKEFLTDIFITKIGTKEVDPSRLETFKQNVNIDELALFIVKEAKRLYDVLYKMLLNVQNDDKQKQLFIDELKNGELCIPDVAALQCAKLLENMDTMSSEEIKQGVMEVINCICENTNAYSDNYLSMFKIALSDDFKEVINDKTNEIGKANELTRKEFESEGIDFNKWANPKIDPKEITLADKPYTLTLLERDPFKEFNIGNQTSCCTGAGDINGQATPIYLESTAFNVIKLQDESDRTNAMARLHLAKIDGKPSVIVDNLEINNTFLKNLTAADRDGVKKMRKKIFDYAKKISSEIGATGKTYFSSNFSKVPTDDLESKNKKVEFMGELPVEKIYLNSVGLWVNPKKDFQASDTTLLAID